uniref:RanBP2-type domain-containing protein n=1 Tax=Chromera velia CCMP2878 TaxID=1169474 RepID=A0A0G4I8Z8_9ALVE|eukprot:Cvel_2011.t1-p1 / transcript=Cvel_2011.t1 / gene=Cvel_2011 / organism=Chromera_velia_CCMP2878 / gene_product=hypothetical protein / transcript_product=hypothetical protein / location=Cvel_scaffold77:49688-55059(-) / protein_length=882 / sequence_SO=supercontig / SO=protein_coding / is_pseudo=false
MRTSKRSHGTTPPSARNAHPPPHSRTYQANTPERERKVTGPTTTPVVPSPNPQVWVQQSQQEACEAKPKKRFTSRWIIQREYSRVRLYRDFDPKEPLRPLVEKMKEYSDLWKASDVDVFWHRKSKKVVLAVLQVWNDRSNQFEYYKGMNTEISLPSGSNCAERAAISAAVSARLDLTRRDIRAVAVLDPQDELNPIAPCGVCDEWLKKIQEESTSFSVLTFENSQCELVVERCPFIFQEMSYLADEGLPKLLQNHWACRKCGFQFNEPKAAKCRTCKGSRYKFKPELEQQRIQIMGLITTTSPHSVSVYPSPEGGASGGDFGTGGAGDGFSFSVHGATPAVDPAEDSDKERFHSLSPSASTSRVGSTGRATGGVSPMPGGGEMVDMSSLCVGSHCPEPFRAEGEDARSDMGAARSVSVRGGGPGVGQVEAGRAPRSLTEGASRMGTGFTETSAVPSKEGNQGGVGRVVSAPVPATVGESGPGAPQAASASAASFEGRSVSAAGGLFGGSWVKTHEDLVEGAVQQGMTKSEVEKVLKDLRSLKFIEVCSAPRTKSATLTVSSAPHTPPFSFTASVTHSGAVSLNGGRKDRDKTTVSSPKCSGGKEEGGGFALPVLNLGDAALSDDFDTSLSAAAEGEKGRGGKKEKEKEKQHQAGGPPGRSQRSRSREVSGASEKADAESSSGSAQSPSGPKEIVEGRERSSTVVYSGAPSEGMPSACPDAAVASPSLTYTEGMPSEGPRSSRPKKDRERGREREKIHRRKSHTFRKSDRQIPRRSLSASDSTVRKAGRESDRTEPRTHTGANSVQRISTTGTEALGGELVVAYRLTPLGRDYIDGSPAGDAPSGPSLVPNASAGSPSGQPGGATDVAAPSMGTSAGGVLSHE